MYDTYRKYWHISYVGGAGFHTYGSIITPSFGDFDLVDAYRYLFKKEKSTVIILSWQQVTPRDFERYTKFCETSDDYLKEIKTGKKVFKLLPGGKEIENETESTSEN